jgi:thioredoxin 1
MSAVLDINSLNDLNEKIKDNMTVVVFSAGFCKPCKEIYPYIEKIAETHTNITFVKVDIVEGSEISEKYEIQTIPHFKFFKENKEIVTFSGANKQNITEAINKLLE